MNLYRDKYTFRHPIGEFGLTHSTGAVSICFEWDGVDTQMKTSSESEFELDGINNLICELPYDVSLELHQIRYVDDSIAHSYNDLTEQLIRSKDVCTRFRQDIANHYAGNGRSNAIIGVLTARGKRGFTLGQSLKNEKKAYDVALKAFEPFKKRLKASLLSINDFASIIKTVKDRDSSGVVLEDYLPLTELVIDEKPIYEDGLISCNGVYSKTFLAVWYPDVSPGFLESFSFYPIDTHFSIYLNRLNVGDEIRKSERQTDREDSGKGKESSQLKMSAQSHFRAEVQANNYSVFDNVLVFTFSDRDKDLLFTITEDFKEKWSAMGGTLRTNEYIQYEYFVRQTPSQLSRTQFSRTDHNGLLKSLLPVISPNNGMDRPAILRMTNTGTLVGFDYPRGALNHSFTIGRSGGGKDVETNAQIIETFGLGYDWYVTEVDPSYKWTVQALGGNYIDYDPNENVLNPFPTYAEADLEAEHPFTNEIKSPIISALAPLLIDRVEMTHAERSVCEQAFDLMFYSEEQNQGIAAPSLGVYLEALKFLPEEGLNTLEREARKLVVMSLESFLSTQAGKKFKQPDNMRITPHICGINLKKVIAMQDKRMAAFLLTFIALRFAQLSDSTGNPSFIFFNEFQEFTAANREIMSNTARQVSRMGRKGGNNLRLVTQDIEDIHDLGTGVIQQMQQRSFTFMSGGHGRVHELIPDLPIEAMSEWKSMPDPDSLIGYREQIKSVGKRAWRLYISLPESLLLLSNTNEQVLPIKAKIEKQTDDVFERLTLLKQALSEL